MASHNKSWQHVAVCWWMHHLKLQRLCLLPTAGPARGASNPRPHGGTVTPAGLWGPSAAKPQPPSHVSEIGFTGNLPKGEAELPPSLAAPGGAVLAGLGQACWSLSALRRVCGHEAVRLAPPVHVVPGDPGSRLGAAAVPPAGRQRPGPAPETR